MIQGCLCSSFNGDNYRYVELNMTESETFLNKFKPVERVYIKYEQNNNVPTHKYLLTNQIEM